MKKYFIFFTFIPILFADSEMGCSISGLLQASKNSLLENKRDSNCTKSINKEASLGHSTTAISKQLMSVKVYHEQVEVLIERELLNGNSTCPPFCIEPMQIKEVRTVGELEVLAFIDKLKEKKARLLIDVRENNFYAEGTIPGAINLPFSMLKDGSKYQAEVLGLLGAKFNKLKWSFKKAQRLLIFGSSATSPEASNSVKKLLELGYPSPKLYYYRGGVSSWKALGLTVF